MGPLETVLPGFHRSVLARFGVAFLVTLLALLVGRALGPFTGGSEPYLAALVALAFCAWYCGTGPSIASLALSTLGIAFWVPPTHSLPVPHAADWWNILAFSCAGAMIVGVGEAKRREREQLRAAAGELEEKVQERTSELDGANQSLRELTARLLNLQDEERRRIARELHDNAGQALSVLAINLGAVAKDLERVVKTAGMVADSASIVQQMSSDIRTMSYLLHPPLLDEMGLESALRWYVDGFAQRSKIAVDFECTKDLGRLSRETETVVFRVIQECLTNIHRHSGSPIAAIQVVQSDGHLQVEVKDEGKGLLPETREQMISGGTVGVGIRGMRERVGQLGGNLEIISDGPGTGTRVVVRLPASEPTRAEQGAKAAEVA